MSFFLSLKWSMLIGMIVIVPNVRKENLVPQNGKPLPKRIPNSFLLTRVLHAHLLRGESLYLPKPKYLLPIWISKLLFCTLYWMSMELPS